MAITAEDIRKFFRQIMELHPLAPEPDDPPREPAPQAVPLAPHPPGPSGPERRAQLEAILSDPASDIFKAYEAFCAKELSAENIQFTRECRLLLPKLVQLAQAFQRGGFSAEDAKNDEEVQSELQKLYGDFIHTEAAREINVSSGMRVRLQNRIPKLLTTLNGKNPQAADVTQVESDLKAACHEIVTLQVSDTFNRFRRTQEYKDYQVSLAQQQGN